MHFHVGGVVFRLVAGRRVPRVPRTALLGGVRIEPAADLGSLLLLPQLALAFGLDLQVLNRQVDYLVSEAGLFGGVRGRREVPLTLEPEEVLVLLVVASLRLVEEFLEAWHIELAPQVKLVCLDLARVLAELVECLESARAVLAPQVRRQLQLGRLLARALRRRNLVVRD